MKKNLAVLFLFCNLIVASEQEESRFSPETFLRALPESDRSGRKFSVNERVLFIESQGGNGPKYYFLKLPFKRGFQTMKLDQSLQSPVITVGQFIKEDFNKRPKF